MCEYLVAQFSLKRSGAEGLTAEQLAHRADRLSGTAGLAQLAELATDLHGMARDIESA
jgi:hypothetical protein